MAEKGAQQLRPVMILAAPTLTTPIPSLQAGTAAYAMFAADRLNIAGSIVSAIAYFVYIAAVPRPVDSQGPVKAIKSTSPVSGKIAALASLKNLVLAASVLAVCGWAIQLGSIAALTNYGCKGGDGEFRQFPEIPASGRRLLGEPSQLDLETRCSLKLSMDWCVGGAC